MDKPKDEQVKEFWEWCLHECIHDWDKSLIAGITPDAYECVCKKCGRKFDFCHGKFYVYGSSYDFPPIDLNNLFKYAVPIAKSRQKKYRDFASLMLGWLGEVLRGEDPALALFWAIYNVLKVS